LIQFFKTVTSLDTIAFNEWNNADHLLVEYAKLQPTNVACILRNVV